MKLYVNMPVGENYGWAICGKNMLTEMSKLSPDVRYIPDGYENAQRHYKTERMVKALTEKPNGQAYNVLSAIDNVTPVRYKGDKTIGYMFWEQETIPKYLVNQLKDYDVVATGSTWNTEVVKKHGIENAVTIHQGINTDIFKPQDRQYMFDKFVIFSGGKLEYRKGQDIVAHAVGYMQKKYKDVYLVTSWANIFADKEELEKFFGTIKPLLVPERTFILSLSPQKEIAKVIANTDIGIFPNRSEGGTNLVMMEYMACGKPVIANYATGQKDVLNCEYASFMAMEDENQFIEWCFDRLEFAYKNRELNKMAGEKAREAMLPFTWEKTAREFLKLYE